MSKIDDTRLQMYVDNELSYEERVEVENYIKNNQEAKSLVESYKKINHLISSTYNQIKSDDLPKKTLDLLMNEKPNFLKQLMSYEVKLFPALGSVAALAIVVVMSLNFFKVVNSQVIDDIENNTKSIDIFVEEKPTGEIYAAAGAGTSGASFAFGVKENNFLGNGVGLDSNFMISTNSFKGKFTAVFCI